ncbi:FUSC family protein [Mycobacterium sp.]|uniref:FUSC family protein n=1 Tax=Mycobacterium sp. TaxID=1785 RepID=UPI003F9A572A
MSVPWVTWSTSAAIRAVRATIVVTGLFALTLEVIGDRQQQMCLFATFGALSTVVFTDFGGTRRDVFLAQLGLAGTAGLALTIGTVVNQNLWLATLVTIAVAFVIFFAGVIGPNAAGATSTALLAYVLAVASPGTAETIPHRLAGWWLASAVSTAAILLVPTKNPGDRLRASAAAAAAALGRQLRAAVRGAAAPAETATSLAATNALREAFAATPYRPTGLATADQAMANAVQVLQWCGTLTADATDDRADPSQAVAADRELLGVAADVLEDTAALFSGAVLRPAIDRLEATRATRGAHRRALPDDPEAVRVAAAQAYQAQVIAIAARTAAADALIATRHEAPEMIAAERRSWYGLPQEGPPQQESRLGALTGSLGVVYRYASLRSVWFLNAVRGSVALAIAVAVADITGVEHRFWVVLGTLSALRTNATATGSTAWRALAGTTLGFAVGGALLAAIGTGPVALWTVLPIAVFVATYTPGTAPFVLGQAAFTLTNVVAFNLLTAAGSGWHVGAVRVADVAIGCGVSLFVATLFWPRGAGPLVGDNLADAFRSGAAYLVQAVDWALGLRPDEPDTAIDALTAGTRLDDALRGYLAEQGAKPLSKDDLWQLVMATMRLRLTAHSLAGPRLAASWDGPIDATRERLRQRAAELADFYHRIAARLERPGSTAATPDAAPPPGDAVAQENVAVAELMATAGAVAPTLWIALWVHEHVHHLDTNAEEISGPANRLAAIRQQPWWR